MSSFHLPWQEQFDAQVGELDAQLEILRRRRLDVIDAAARVRRFRRLLYAAREQELAVVLRDAVLRLGASVEGDAPSHLGPLRFTAPTGVRGVLLPATSTLPLTARDIADCLARFRTTEATANQAGDAMKVVVVAHRVTSRLDDRKHDFVPDALAVAVSAKLCLISSAQIFGLLQTVSRDPGAASRSWTELLATDGACAAPWPDDGQPHAPPTSEPRR